MVIYIKTENISIKILKEMLILGHLNILIKMLRGFMNQHLAHGIIQVGIFIQIPY